MSCTLAIVDQQHKRTGQGLGGAGSQDEHTHREELTQGPNSSSCSQQTCLVASRLLWAWVKHQWLREDRLPLEYIHG